MHFAITVSCFLVDDKMISAPYDPGMPRKPNPLPSPVEKQLEGVHLVRHQNLLVLVGRLGHAKAVADAVPGFNTGYVYQLVRKTRGMGSALARRIEDAFGLEKGAMDRPDLGLGGVDRKGKTVPKRQIRLKNRILGEAGQSQRLELQPADGRVGFQSGDPGAFAVAIDGDWGYPRLRHGDIVVLEPNSRIEAGDLALLQLNDGRPQFGVLALIKPDHYSVTGVDGSTKPVTIARSKVAEIQKAVAILLAPELIPSGSS